jgi:putative FmdB family regulatory protein
MPIYGYRCEQCGHELEVLQSMSEAPLKVCPNCMGPLYKMVYPAGIIFKGSGYYTTDYKNSSSVSSSDSSEAVAKSASTSESKADSKSESKPESKSESKPAAEAPKASAKAKPAAD